MLENHGDKELDQDQQLYFLWKERLECTAITKNGVPLKGTVELFDKYVILFRTLSGKQSMIYKHALSTIIAEPTNKTTN
ncbi:RNA chaperone Hfq [Paenibacillus sp. TH7-28]